MMVEVTTETVDGSPWDAMRTLRMEVEVDILKV